MIFLHQLKINLGFFSASCFQVFRFSEGTQKYMLVLSQYRKPLALGWRQCFMLIETIAMNPKFRLPPMWVGSEREKALLTAATMFC